mmetsp:Transcript_57051/g.100150  ORF Transcript_57051/g.100150 Transcript_57051/m.100150 type:complete len:315 (+) Transcript_57051:1925-2869(+)
MRQGGGIGEAVEHLYHASLCGRAAVAPVARGERVLQTVGDRGGLHRLRHVESAAFVDGLLQVLLHLLGEFLEQHAELTAQQWARKVQALLTKMITIVLLNAAQRAHQHLVHRVANEEGLLGLAVLHGADVGQSFFLQNLTGILNTLATHHTLGAASLADEIKRRGLRADRARLLERRAEALHHLQIRKVINNVFEHILVRDEAQRAEHNHHRNGLANVGQRAADLVAINSELATGLVHLQSHGGSGARAGRDVRASLTHPLELVRLHLPEHVDVVVGQTLLGDNDLLRAVDDEITTLVEDALTYLGQVTIHATV